MTKLLRNASAASFALLLLAGCGKSADPVAPVSPPGTAEQAAVADELARHPELVEEGLYESASQTAFESEGAGLAAIDPLFFWRQILRVERSFEFAFADTDTTGQPTTAVVTIHKRLAGWFNVVAREGTHEGSPPEGRLVQKPLRDHWVRRVLLKRVPNAHRDHRPWRIAAVSGVKITSRDAETRIESLRIQSGALDVTVTDPLAFYRLRHLLRFEPEAEVRLTVTTLRPDDVVLLYLRDRRFRFHNNGDNTYTARWRARAIDGVRHFGVNALSRGTLFDDEAPYDSQTWILPYVMPPTELADLAP